MKSSAFEKTQNWIKKNSYQGGYDKQLYKHKSKPKTVSKPKTKRIAAVTPKTNLIDSALADRNRRYKPYKIVNKAAR